MNKNILVIDIETTNFLDRGGSIVEVGAVALDLESGETETVLDQVCREAMLTAKHREHPFGWIFRNSSLTVDEVRDGMPFEELQPRIQEVVDSYPLGATAFNRNFDFDFLEDRGIRFGRKLPCPMLVATPICRLLPIRYGDYKWPKVEEAWRHFFPDRPYVEQHRGADDAHHEALIVHALYERGHFKI